MFTSRPYQLSAARIRGSWSRTTAIAVMAAAVTILVAPLAAQDSPPQDSPATDQTYKLPPRILVDLVDAPPTPAVSLSPDYKTLVIMGRKNLPPIATLAERELRLAGIRISPQTNGPSRTRSPIEKLTFKNVEDLVEREIPGLPADGEIANVRWSPDATRLAFTVTDDKSIELWVAELKKDGVTKRVLRQRLNAVRGRPYRWLPDSKTLVCTIVPEKRGPEPVEPTVPLGPIVQENLGQTSPARTYQDLLKNPHHENLFEHYATSQLMRVDVGGKRKRLGEPGIITGFSVSPNGEYLLVQTLHRPFSYLVPHYRFPRRVEVWDLDGNLIKRVADLPLHEGVPTAFGSVPTGPRSFEWRSDTPATLVWVEAQDGGDARAEAEIRDKVFALAAPFTGAPRTLATLTQRYSDITWGTGDLAIVREWWWKTRNVKTWRIRPDNPAAEADLIFDMSWEDRYGDPGDFVTHRNDRGHYVLLPASDGALFLFGTGASPEGNRPFVDQIDLATKETNRLWRSQAPYYERPAVILDTDQGTLLTRRESPQEPPNYFVRNMKTQNLRQLTEFPHPTPQLAGIQKELIRYQREDGVRLNGTLYLPAGYKKEDGPLPVVMWAYPQEFKSADAAGQITDSPYRFDRVGWWSPLVWLTQGYAVLDDPTLPIVGEGDEEPNDTYISQLVAGAQAAVDEVARRGVGDPDRVAIGGHSYGAFMAANLLAHSDIFRAGIARSGAYNRTLTPFGFQAEERTVWEAPEVYFKMSPFMHAEKINEPILLIHGKADNNSGTFPMQSERFYNALKGLGATARLVMLPHESHGYQARESILHMMWETNRWLEQYVKNPKPKVVDPEADDAAAGK